jgi:hypothetical protein
MILLFRLGRMSSGRLSRATILEAGMIAYLGKALPLTNEEPHADHSGPHLPYDQQLP